MDSGEQNHRLKVFLGWSGARSYQIALALHEWLPRCVPEIEPWVSASDIDVGQGWNEQLEQILKTCDCGIYCITAENGLAPWLNFEAGAIFARTPSTLLFPYLFDAKQTTLSKPLSRFQAVNADREGTKRMIDQCRSAVRSSGPDLFDEKWVELEMRLEEIRNRFGTAPDTFYQLSAGAGLDYRTILSDARREIIMTAQNMQSLLRAEPFALFTDLLERRHELTLDIILTVPEFFTSVSQKALNRDAVLIQYGDTLKELERFVTGLPKRMRQRVAIYFHPGVSSLSSFIRDPGIDENAMMAFVPKWATDLDPDNRIFCLVRKVDNRELFSKLTGHLGMMRNRFNSMTLDQMIPYFAKYKKEHQAGAKRWWKRR